MTSPAYTGSAAAVPDTPPDGGVTDLRRTQSAQDAIAEVIDSMEQGVLVWSEDAVCEMYNQRIFDVLELGPRDLHPGIRRSEFLRMAVARGEFDAETAAKAEKRFEQLAPFSFDRVMPSGAVIATTARPRKSGGFVVTFTDVTEARRKELELEAQREKSRAAEIRANEALAHERDRKKEARGLAQLDEWLQSCKSLNELLLVVGRFLSRLFEGSAGELYIYSNSRDVLDGACSWGIDSPKAHIQPDECWGLRRGRLYQYETGQVNFSCNHVSDAITDDHDGRYLCIPIIAHGDTVGLLHIRFARTGTDEQDAVIAPGLVEFAIRCSERISLAIANVKLRDELRDQSTKDPLTGLYNRRHFLDRCRREISHAERCGQPLGLISLDADSFKKFNDTHGHDAGDQVLRGISDVMMDMFGGAETVARFGGEEFSILLPGATPETALERAEALRERIENNVLRYDDRALPKVTISAGVSAYPANGTSPQELLRQADRALYQAKDSGRNRVVLAAAPRPAAPVAEDG
ncbi:diguanylate cyclase [Roseovarius sp. CAU 1744]|uniref:sensor domain-containing diguanylate cyclase n=1 Tax=Roseovarius sp. CAU 1744 TaxID=3140368 RepID=UPI00325B7078